MQVFSYYRFEKVCSSKRSISTDHSFRIALGTLKKPDEGSGGTALPITDLDLRIPLNSYSQKRAFVDIPTCDYMCCARAIVTCLAKTQMSQKDFDHFRTKKRWQIDKPDSQMGQARLLLKSVGLPEDRAIRVNELHMFESYLDVQIVVISGDILNEVTYKGSITRDRKIYLYHANGHFTSIVNVDGLIPDKKLCIYCFRWYSNRSLFHSCKGACGVCFRHGCFRVEEEMRVCRDCNMTVRSDECMDAHKVAPEYRRGEKIGEVKGPAPCDSFFKCPTCEKVVNRSRRPAEAHMCGEHFCKQCQMYVEDGHYCYYRAKNQKKISNKYIFFDYECTQDGRVPCSVEGCQYEPNPQPGCLDCPPESLCSSCRRCIYCLRSYCGTHQFTPNLVCSQTSCDLCENDEWSDDAECAQCGYRCDKCFVHDKEGVLKPPCRNGLCGHRQMIFHGADANDRFCSFLFSKRHKGYIGLAHCAKAFDSHFLLGYLVANAQTPKVIFNGAKIMRLSVPSLNISIIDSINFLPMALAKLPSCLGLDPTLRKGSYPHLFNTAANQGVVLPHLPDIWYYSVDFMNPEARQELLEWHSENYYQVFDNDYELISYCASDVTILRAACVKFKNLVKSATTIEGLEVPGINVFVDSTIAGSSMTIFKQLLLTEYHCATLQDGSEVDVRLKGGVWSRTDTGEKLDPDTILRSRFVKSNVPQPPARGYNNSHANHSLKSIIWLEYVAQQIGRPIRHARNGGEKQILQYYVDGYDEVQG